uniref:Uncharacterized protein n=1 Tax=Hemiselmis andersenii TaxID=464988 RepID=A0A6U4RL58_HEMAN|mmetsp:Transcript_7949/g.18385  ORF Transcript_7949/g.18385 Transcript_7949/m.18385 type:complete len:108 (+) Transcript_7949:53-376(+)|eukprot:CAMPEP_0172012562 /NCGR_PEP_ID=MMETSP1041-20130122/8908_1 /TAXON_ID=464988 /ORGANISM="Hemiselmis andersenii, Strain CCMP439" /LENGTH=107 /DNA_ID=CAMNT_0012667155 /DNA_START=39 /DNA_END=362 /DNA_ORIENTATION=+
MFADIQQFQQLTFYAPTFVAASDFDVAGELGHGYGWNDYHRDGTGLTFGATHIVNWNGNTYTAGGSTNPYHIFSHSVDLPSLGFGYHYSHGYMGRSDALVYGAEDTS